MAIEVELIGPGVDVKWLYGHFRLWIAGKALGDFEDSADLAGGARLGRLFLSAGPRRTRPDLDNEEAKFVYWTLFARFLERGGSAPDEPFERDPYLLDELGDSSLRDSVTVLVVRRADGRDRIIVHEHLVLGESWEHIVPAGTCDEVIASYCAWVEAQMIKGGST